jgi:hypothetical protein
MRIIRKLDAPYTLGTQLYGRSFVWFALALEWLPRVAVMAQGVMAIYMIMTLYFSIYEAIK